MGKGSGRRPAAISAQEFAEKWAQTFGVYGIDIATKTDVACEVFGHRLPDGTVVIDSIKRHRAEANADAQNTTQSEGSPDA